MVELDASTPSDTFLKLISGHKLARKASSLLTQICTGHIPLNGYLYKFKRVDNPRCPACRAAVETVGALPLHVPLLCIHALAARAKV